MDKTLKLEVKPILDTNSLKKQLALKLPSLKLDIDTSYLNEQIQTTIGKLSIAPVNVPIHLNINYQEIQSAINANTARQEKINAVSTMQVPRPAIQSAQFPASQTVQATVSQMQTAAKGLSQPETDTGFLKGVLNTGKEATRTYNELAGTIGTAIGLLDGTAVSNFTQSLD